MACSIACEGILFAKDPLGEVVHPSKCFHSRCHCPVHLSVQSINLKVKCTFEPRTRYCHIHLACTNVRYERKMHVLIIRK